MNDLRDHNSVGGDRGATAGATATVPEALPVASAGFETRVAVAECRPPKAEVAGSKPAGPTYTCPHCWEEGPELEDGYNTTCLLLDGHEGAHQWTRDDQIVVTFGEDESAPVRMAESFRERAKRWWAAAKRISY